MENASDQVRNVALKLLEDKKALDIIEIVVSDQNRLCDVCIIASGTSARHMQSLAEIVYRAIKALGVLPHIEGDPKSGWMLIEAEGIEIHLFKPELRSYYNIEELLKTEPFKHHLPQE